MFMLQIVLKDTLLQPPFLMFNKKESLEEQLNVFKMASPEAPITLTDEFGQKFDGFRRDIACTLAENMDESLMAAVERTLHGQRVGAQTQLRIENDPTIRGIQTRSRLATATGFTPPNFGNGRG